MPDRWLEELSERVQCELKSRPLQFLVERELEDVERSRLYDELSRRYPELWRPVFGPCIALAAVHAAADASREDTSLIELFYRRLHMPSDQRAWNDEHGPAIIRFLEEHFPDKPDAYDRTGPYRYVGVVYRHAGIPAVGLPAFAQLLTRLFREHGRHFSRREYDAVLPAALPRCVSEFLNSDTGYAFTVATAGVYYRLRLSLAETQEAGNIPGYRKGFWTELLRLLRRDPPPPPKEGYPPPFLALDAGRLQLQLCFDKAGVAKGIYSFGGTRVLNPVRPVNSQSRPAGGFRHPATGSWEISVDQWWWPGQTGAALFRTSDGRFVASAGAVRPGDYYVVVTQTVSLPHEIVREDLGVLDVPSHLQGDQYYYVFRVSLAPGTSLSDLGFFVAGSEPIPSLEFAEGFTHPRLGSDVYVGELPRLVVSNWPEDTTHDYWLWVEVGEQRRRLLPTSGRSEHPLAVSVPCQGQIVLEPRGFLRQGGEPQVLGFTVVPRGIRFRWRPLAVGVDEDAILEVELPPGWQAAWQNAEARPAGSGRQTVRVLPAVVRLDGTLFCETVSLATSLKVPRVGLELKGDRAKIVWIEEADLLPPVLQLEAPARYRVNLVALDGPKAQTVWEGTPMPRAGLRDVSWLEWATAARTFPGMAAQLAVHPRGCPFVGSSVYFAFSDRIRQHIGTLPADSAVFALPGLGPALRSADSIVRQPQAVSCIPGSVDLASPLCDWLLVFARGAQVFDGTELLPPINPECPPAERRFADLLAWVQAARQAHVQLEPRPPWNPDLDEVLTGLPVERWQGIVRSLLAETPDPVRVLCEWRDCIARNSRLATQVLGDVPGAHQITEGARRYLQAVTQTQTGRDRRTALGAAIRDLRQIEVIADVPKALIFASRSLWQLALYRLDEFEQASQLSIDSPTGPFACLAASMKALAAHCRALGEAPVWPAGVGFAELSPCVEDAELERALGRPSPKVEAVLVSEHL